MFNHSGRKLQGIAVAAFLISAFVGLMLALLVPLGLYSNPYFFAPQIVFVLIGAIIFFLIAFFAWIVSLGLYAFGKIAETQEAFLTALNNGQFMRAGEVSHYLPKTAPQETAPTVPVPDPVPSPVPAKEPFAKVKAEPKSEPEPEPMPKEPAIEKIKEGFLQPLKEDLITGVEKAKASLQQKDEDESVFEATEQRTKETGKGLFSQEQIEYMKSIGLDVNFVDPSEEEWRKIEDRIVNKMLESGYDAEINSNEEGRLCESIISTTSGR